MGDAGPRWEPTVRRVGWNVVLNARHSVGQVTLSSSGVALEVEGVLLFRRRFGGFCWPWLRENEARGSEDARELRCGRQGL